MKKIIQYFMVATIFVACKSKSELDTSKDVILTDTTGMYKSNMMTDTGSVIETSTVTPGTQNRTAVANRRTTNTYRAPRTRARTYSNNNTVNRNTGSNTSNTSNNGGYSNQTTTAPQKRGMSSAAKGAIIGGVGGAVLGGVVKGGKGAVVGGVAGAAGGYIIGRKKDKRTGRAQ